MQYKHMFFWNPLPQHIFINHKSLALIGVVVNNLAEILRCVNWLEDVPGSNPMALTQEQDAELDRRYRFVKANPEKGKTWDEFVKSL